MPDDALKVLWKADELPAQERAFTQRLNPNSHLLRTGLSRLAGLKRAHVSLGRIPPGKDSFAYHSHMVEEEWVYILRSEEHTSELQSQSNLVCRLLLEKKKRAARDHRGRISESSAGYLRNGR